MNYISDRFIHEQAVCTTTQVGEGTLVRSCARLSPLARVGESCCIFEGVIIEKNVVIGDRVVIKGGANISEGVAIGDDSFIGAGVKINGCVGDSEKGNYIVIGSKVVLGDGVQVLANITIGDGAVVGAGVVVTESIPPFAIVNGEPAKTIGSALNAISSQSASVSGKDAIAGVQETSVRGVTLHNIHKVIDSRGNLSMGEFGRNIPFMVSRYFLVYDVPAEKVRGDHAHFRCHQFLIVVKGSVSVIADDGDNREEFILDRADKGLYLPPVTWGIQYNYSSDAVLLVLASDYYDNEDYIRSYDEFLAHIASTAGASGV